MTAPLSPVAAGGMLAYEAGVTNDGADPAPDAESVVVPLPEVTVVDAGPCDVLAGRPDGRCPLGDVAPGGSEAFAIGVTVDAPPATGSRPSSPKLTPAALEPQPSDNCSAVVTVAESDNHAGRP